MLGVLGLLCLLFSVVGTICVGCLTVWGLFVMFACFDSSSVFCCVGVCVCCFSFRVIWCLVGVFWTSWLVDSASWWVWGRGVRSPGLRSCGRFFGFDSAFG